jgi:hypothetical protein
MNLQAQRRSSKDIRGIFLASSRAISRLVVLGRCHTVASHSTDRQANGVEIFFQNFLTRAVAASLMGSKIRIERSRRLSILAALDE